MRLARSLASDRDLKEMPDLHNDRLQAFKKLESAQNELSKTALKLKGKDEKTASKKKGEPMPEKWNASSLEESEATLAQRLVPEKNRPSHRLPKVSWFPNIPFILQGKKVDTIEWCKDEIIEKSNALKAAREQLQRDIDSPGITEDEVYPPLK